MFGYVTFNMNYYISSQIFYKKMGDRPLSLIDPETVPFHLPQTSNGSCALTGWLSLRIADRQYLPSGSDRHLMLKTSSNSRKAGLKKKD